MWIKTIIKKNYRIKCLLNMFLNLFFRHNNLISVYFHNLASCKFTNLYDIFSFSRMTGIHIPVSSRLYNCKFFTGHEGKIFIGKYCNLKCLNVYMEDSNNELFVGDYVTVNAFKRHEVRLHIVEGSKIQIGDNCLFSNSIQMHTSDFHSILDYSGNRINDAMPIIFNNNVWVGFGPTILKGVCIGSNSVVGANSNVPRDRYPSNSIIGGNPAKIIKTNIQWKKERV